MPGVVLITGGSRGIGAATAVLAAARGYAVCVNYRANAEAADAVVTAIAEAGGSAIAVQGDVSVESDVVRLFETCDARLGPLTALVNNAAILETQTRVESVDAARLQRILAANVTGAFICAREAVKRMSTRHGGSAGYLKCEVDDSGSLTIPANLITALIDLGVAGFPQLTLRRSTRAEAQVGAAAIALQVVALSVPTLEIEGYCSCFNNADCGSCGDATKTSCDSVKKLCVTP